MRGFAFNLPFPTYQKVDQWYKSPGAEEWRQGSRQQERREVTRRQDKLERRLPAGHHNPTRGHPELEQQDRQLELDKKVFLEFVAVETQGTGLTRVVTPRINVGQACPFSYKLAKHEHVQVLSQML